MGSDSNETGCHQAVTENDSPDRATVADASCSSFPVLGTNYADATVLCCGNEVQRSKVATAGARRARQPVRLGPGAGPRS